MDKKYLYEIGLKKYFLSHENITQIILKNKKINLTQLFLLKKIKYTKRIINDFEKFKTNIPIEYILNKANFYGFDFFINKNVLIPRNDTEILVSQALNIINGKKQKYTLIDIGTGSGCIPISILKNTKNISNTFVIDTSKKALKICYKNILDYYLENKIEILNNNLLKNINFGKLEKNIILTANLPYIKKNDFNNMDKRVIKYEPSLALYGGKKTGFELYEKLISQILDFKQKNIFNNTVLFIEIGFDQYEYSKKFLQKKGLIFEYFKDLNNIYRVIKIII